MYGDGGSTSRGRLIFQRVGAHVIHAEHPFRRNLTLHAEGPLLGIWIEQRVLITDKRAGGEELVQIRAVAGAHIKAAQRRLRRSRKRRQRHSGDTGREPDLPRRRNIIENTSRPGKRVVGLRIVDDLRIVNAEAAAKYRSVPVIGESGARREILVRIGKGLAFIAQAEVDGQVRANLPVVLNEQRPEPVVDRVIRVAVALRVALDVADVAQERLALANRDCGGAGVVNKFAVVNRSAELLAVPAGVSQNAAAAELHLMISPHGGKRVADLILPVLQQRRLRCAGGERSSGRDGHRVLRAVNHGIEFCDRRGKLELQTHAV